MRKTFMAIAALLFTWSACAQKTASIQCDADEVVKLWDNKTAPHSSEEQADEVLDKNNFFFKTSETVLYLYKADPRKATGQAVVVIPGGGYGAVCIPHEGFELAKYYRSLGLTVAVLKYRLPNNGHKIVPLEDAQEAMRYVRKNAVRLHVNPGKVGICGSSAGGHLAAYASTFTPDAEKPAFTILFYPVITGTTFRTHQGTFANLLGEGRTDVEQAYYSLENRVTPTTPPTLLMLSDDDTVVPTISSILYYKALKENGVFASLHIWPSGGHGWAGHDEFKYAVPCKEILKDWLKLME